MIGWSELGDIDPAASRDDLKQRSTSLWRASAASLASQAGQIYRFVNEVAVGDLVVLPLMSKPGHVAVARVTGAYEYRDGAVRGD